MTVWPPEDICEDLRIPDIEQKREEMKRKIREIIREEPTMDKTKEASQQPFKEAFKEAFQEVFQQPLTKKIKPADELPKEDPMREQHNSKRLPKYQNPIHWVWKKGDNLRPRLVTDRRQLNKNAIRSDSFSASWEIWKQTEGKPKISTIFDLCRAYHQVQKTEPPQDPAGSQLGSGLATTPEGSNKLGDHLDMTDIWLTEVPGLRKEVDDILIQAKDPT